MRRGFTLIELLVAVTIVAVIAGIGLSIPTGDKRFTAVQSAARELAAYLRRARAEAMRSNGTVAVSFNLANGKGTSGMVLNNWGGGHWYRMVGPSEFDYSRGNYGVACHPDPGHFWHYANGDNECNVPILLRRMRSAWIGDLQRLAAHRVRFLALTDLDLGHSHQSRGATPEATFPATYPRPWCGWWDPATSRLRPWGGYDPTLVDNRGRANSAFYYQGADGVISGCQNPATRVSQARGNEVNFQTSGGMDIFRQGEVRPLANAEWMDWYISFRPDGTATAGRFGEVRFESLAQGSDAVLGAVPNGDLGDLATSYVSGGLPAHTYDMATSLFPATTFQTRSGYWYVTLAPDADRDSDVFTSADVAARSLGPIFRVGVNAIGDVRVVQVRNSLPAGRVLGTTINGAQWQAKATTDSYFQGNLLTNADGTPRGEPIVDTLIPDMLLRRAFWYE